jgi:hypothetical protein
MLGTTTAGAAVMAAGASLVAAAVGLNMAAYYNH